MKFDLTRHWYRNDFVAFLLWPLSMAFCAIAQWRRRRIERQGILLSQNAPVIIVGNITVGGTGKTPMVIWLTQFLKAQGYRVGVVSRGYRGANTEPLWVTSDSSVHEVGDEAVIIARRTGVPVYVGADRVSTANLLLANHLIDVIVSDDGLQHYRLPRDIEIAMIDGDRRFGNGLCLPAGPLREKPSRLREVDLRLVTGGVAGEDEYPMTLAPGRLVNLHSPGRNRALESMRGLRVHAIAGIGNPERFFRQLEQAGLDVIRHPFADHHRFQADDLHFTDNLPVLMTEKDAVKCGVFAEPDFWYLPIEAELPDKVGRIILQKLKEPGIG